MDVEDVDVFDLQALEGFLGGGDDVGFGGGAGDEAACPLGVDGEA